MLKNIFASVVVTGFSVILFAGCSSAPYSKGYALLPDSVREAHDYSRASQYKTNKGKFPAPAVVAEQLDKRTLTSDCFKITQVYHQWGVLEPEMIFLGESMGDTGQKAYIIVPPILDENVTFPTPAEDKINKVFRIDQDSPHGPGLIAQIQNLIGDANRCVRFVKVPASEQAEMSVIGAVVLPKSAYKPPEVPVEPLKKPEEVKPEVKPETKQPEVKQEAKPEEKKS
jgi:hypothetical protein